ncbi:MAG: DsbA family protein [Neomegalonema sp.]|nr:DsbA family protein [Neomegalonema sp.]
MKRIALTVAAGVLALGAVAFMFGKDNEFKLGSEVLSTPAAAEETAATKTSADKPKAGVDAFKAKGYAVGDIVLGDPKAPVTVIEYMRLTCPACGAFHKDTLPKLKKKYVETGKVKLILREVFADARGVIAAGLARCAGPDSYHSFIDVLFERMDDWTAVTNMKELRAKIGPIGRLGGLTSEAIDACIADTAFLDHVLQTAQKKADEAKITKTPTIFVNGKEFTGRYYDFDALSAMIDKASK